MFQRLSEDPLLEECLDGEELLNGMIWEGVPKGTFIGSVALQLGVHGAVVHFNIGCQAGLNILIETGIEPGVFCVSALKKAHNLRKSKANYK